MLQATEVHVGRADSRYLIVNEKELGVEEAVGVLVDLYPRFEELCEVRVSSEGRQARVRLEREHQLDLYTSKSCRDKSVVEIFCREEVGRLDADAMAGSRDHIDDRLLDSAPVANRATLDELYRRRILVWLSRRIKVAVYVDDLA